VQIIVSGATGFIGRNLIFDFLQRKENSVIALVRDTKNVTQLNRMCKSYGPERLSIFDVTKLEQLASMEKINPRLVVHLANKYTKSPSWSESAEMLNVNLSFGLDLANLANQFNVCFVYASSYMEYLDDFDQSVSAYVNGKREFSKKIRTINGLNVVENIVWDTYGQGDTRNRVVSFMVSQVKNQIPVALDYPDNLISLTHVRDVSSAITQSFSSRNATFLCGSAAIISIGELYEAILALNENANSEILHPNHELKLFNSLSKTYEHPPNWKPQVTLKDGILEMLRE
jgi:nucleoside-diphosphate-sugar epimerase